MGLAELVFLFSLDFFRVHFGNDIEQRFMDLGLIRVFQTGDAFLQALVQVQPGCRILFFTADLVQKLQPYLEARKIDRKSVV